MLQAIKADILTVAPGGFACVPGGYLVTQNGIVRGVFDALPAQYKDALVEDFGGALLTPSFNDLHLHAPQYPMVGMGMDLQLIDWLNAYAFKTEACFADAAYARHAYARLAQALIRAGTTRVCMFSSLHVEATLILMEELEKAGVTGYVGKVNMDRNGGENLQETTEGSLQDTLRFLDACGGFSLVRPILTPRFTPSCTDALMKGLGELAAARDLRVQSHLSENPDEIAWVKRLHPDCAQYWETYAKFGLWRPDTVMAHCVHSDERERRAMREGGVYMIHCPDSNRNIRSGNAPVRRAMNEGVRVALGSDIAGGALLHMADVTAAAIRVSKQRWLDTEGADAFLQFHEAFALATDAGAAYFGAGPGFAPGDALHAIVWDESALPPACRALTMPERLERIFYLPDARGIKAVYSAGKRRI